MPDEFDKVKLEDETILAIRDDYFKKNHRTPSLLECYIIAYYGSDMHKQLADYAFEYTCLEAEYLKMPKGRQFNQMGKINLEKMCTYFFQRLPEQIRLVKINKTLQLLKPNRTSMLCKIMKNHLDDMVCKGSLK